MTFPSAAAATVPPPPVAAVPAEDEDETLLGDRLRKSAMPGTENLVDHVMNFLF